MRTHAAVVTPLLFGLMLGGTVVAQPTNCASPTTIIVSPPCPITPAPSPLPQQQPEQQPELPAQPEVQQPASLAESAQGGTGSQASLDPTMLGDQFGGRARLTFLTDTANVTAGPYRNVPLQPGNQPASSTQAVPVTVFAGGQAFGATQILAVPLRTTVVADQVQGFAPVPIVNQAIPQALASNALATRNGPGVLVINVADTVFVPQSYTGFSFVVIGVPGPGGGGVGSSGSFRFVNGTANYSYSYLATLDVPTPSGGGVVGRTKVSEGNSPMPRDRFIADFDYFENVPLTANGQDVRRYSPGIEKTFFDRRASIEVRFPFASTLDSSVTAGGLINTATEFGNINVTLKALVYGSETLNVATGVGVSLPTASDTRVQLANGTDLLRINNDAVLLTPYLAALFTPNDRFFAQAWGQLGVDANGNPVQGNVALNGLRPVGRFTDATLLQLDAQIGYWLYQSADSSSWLRGLAPFVELHYNTTVSDPDTIASGLFLLRDAAGRIDELNMSAGMTAMIGDNLILNVGAVAPLRQDDNRSFDWQIGLRANYFFGPTARARDRSVPVSNF